MRAVALLAATLIAVLARNACVPTLAAQEANSSVIQIQGAGASFPNAVYQDALFTYQYVASDVAVSYSSMGSGNGKCRIKDAQVECGAEREPMHVDFAASDSLLLKSDYEKYPDLQMLPTMAGGVVPIYNIAGVSDDDPVLVLDRHILARIFLGNITRWNDPELLLLNPGLATRLPDAVIKVTARADNSGTTEIFKTALSLFYPDFQELIGATSKGGAEGWSAPGLTAEDNIFFRPGNKGVCAFVLTQPNSIGYSVLGEAVQLNLKYASILQGGRAVAASSESILYAMLEKGLNFLPRGESTSSEEEGSPNDDGTTHFDDPQCTVEYPGHRYTADLVDTKGLLTWPISGYTYVILRMGCPFDRLRPGSTCDNVRETVNFWRWFYSSPQVEVFAELNGFNTFPGVVTKVLLNRLAQVHCNGVPVIPSGDVLALVSSGSQLKVLSSGTSLMQDIMLQYSSSYGAFSNVRVVYNAGPRRDTDMFIVNTEDELPTSDPSEALVLPFVTMPIAVVWHIPELEAAGVTLCLDLATLALLLSGNIERWDDSRLSVSNPLLAAVHEPVKLVLLSADTDDNVDTALESVLRAYFPGLLSMRLEDEYIKAFSDDHAVAVASETPYSLSVTKLTAGIAPERLAQIAWSENSPALTPSLESVKACLANVSRSEGILSQIRDTASPHCYPLVMPLYAQLPRRYLSEEGCSTAAIPGRQTTEFWHWLLLADNVEKPLRSRGIVHVKDYPVAIRDTVDMHLHSVSCGGVPVLVPESVCEKGWRYSGGSTVCSRCPAGTSSGRGASYCQPCDPGHYCGSETCDSCDSCAIGSFQNAAGRSACQQCPRNTHTHVRGATALADCICKPGFFRIDGQVGKECYPCPLGGVCDGGTHAPYPAKGYWGDWSSFKPRMAPHNDSSATVMTSHSQEEAYNMEALYKHSFHKCTRESACSGDCNADYASSEASEVTTNRSLNLSFRTTLRECRSKAENVCSRKTRGRMCQSCRRGYYTLGGNCFRCLKPESLFVTGSVLLILFIWYLINKVVAGKYDAVDLLLIYFQNASTVARFGLGWTTVLVTRPFWLLEIANFDVTFLSPECTWRSWSYAHGFALQLTMPCIVAAAYFGYYATNKLVFRITAGTCRGTFRPCRIITVLAGFQTTKEGLEHLWDRCVAGTASFLNVVYHTITLKCLEVFMCTNLPNGTSFLSAGPNVRCWQGEHHVYTVVAALGLLLFTVGLPLFLFFVLQFGRYYNLFRDERYMRRWGWLYLRYEREYHFWELVIMVRRAALVGVLVVAVGQPSLQIVLGIGVIVSAITSQFYARPFVSDSLDYLETLSLVSLIALLCCGILFWDTQGRASHGMWDTVVTGMTFVSLLGCLVLVLLFVAREIRQEERRRWVQRRLRRGLDDLLELDLHPPRRSLRDSARALLFRLRFDTSARGNRYGDDGSASTVGEPPSADVVKQAVAKEELELHRTFDVDALTKWLQNLQVDNLSQEVAKVGNDEEDPSPRPQALRQRSAAWRLSRSIRRSTEPDSVERQSVLRFWLVNHWTRDIMSDTSPVSYLSKRPYSMFYCNLVATSPFLIDFLLFASKDDLTLTKDVIDRLRFAQTRFSRKGCLAELVSDIDRGPLLAWLMSATPDMIGYMRDLMIELHNAKIEGQVSEGGQGQSTKAAKQSVADWLVATVIPKPKGLGSCHNNGEASGVPVTQQDKAAAADSASLGRVHQQQLFVQVKSGVCDKADSHANTVAPKPSFVCMSSNDSSAGSSSTSVDVHALEERPSVTPLPEKSKAQCGTTSESSESDLKLPALVCDDGDPTHSAGGSESLHDDSANACSEKQNWQGMFSKARTLVSRRYADDNARKSASLHHLADVVFGTGVVDGSSASQRTFRIREDAKDHASRVVPNRLGRGISNVATFDEELLKLANRGSNVEEFLLQLNQSFGELRHDGGRPETEIRVETDGANDEMVGWELPAVDHASPRKF